MPFYYRNILLSFSIYAPRRHLLCYGFDRLSSSLTHLSSSALLGLNIVLPAHALHML